MLKVTSGFSMFHRYGKGLEMLASDIFCSLFYKSIKMMTKVTKYWLQIVALPAIKSQLASGSLTTLTPKSVSWWKTMEQKNQMKNAPVANTGAQTKMPSVAFYKLAMVTF
jgi:hypothetical protein